MKLFRTSLIVILSTILFTFTVNGESESIAGDGSSGCQMEVHNNTGKCGERIDGGYVCYKINNPTNKKVYADCVS